jgi:hypothetical protein
VGDREFLETYLNSGSKNTSETDIFPHGTKSLLTSVMGRIMGAFIMFHEGFSVEEGCGLSLLQAHISYYDLSVII